ncbi:DUF3857 domain-containing protein [Hydrotalea sp.]|uniref:DUF3857 domain-containing protein n=1 Tax=Hydrotalea sp. TaxID=2881279 RepID=UPI0025881045|nr:DUF3857 domain-containing protein [Hydrotalea sp.]
MKLILLFSLFFLCIQNNAQSLDVHLIPDSITANANAVVRYDNTIVTIDNESKVVVHHNYAITVLNQKGNDYAVYLNTYDQMNMLRDISGTLFDASGKKLKSMKKKDIDDVPVNDNMSLVLDDRRKSYDFFYRSYPYTVVYNNEEIHTQTFQLPNWQPLAGSNISVEQSSFSVTFPSELYVNYKVLQKEMLHFDSVIVNNTKTYTWLLNFKKAIHRELFQPNVFQTDPFVFITLPVFQLQNYTGSMQSWQSFGKFINQLNAGHDMLPDNIKQQVHLLTDHLQNQQQKIVTLYQYLQKNTRYINIALGIGGWQPFDCKYVSDNKYGDCKALSNFMVALLKEAGIKAYYVLISATDRHLPIWKDFPCGYFNHATVCVPDGQDSIWLECTSSSVAPGFASHFTDDRDALLITDSGGIVVHTPTYSMHDNQQNRVVHATIDERGNMQAQVHTLYTGQAIDDVHELLNVGIPEKIQQYYNQNFNLPTYNVQHIQLEEQKSIIPVVKESFEIIVNGFAAVMGKRLFIKPDIFNKWELKLLPDETRKYPIVLKENFLHTDSIFITIPTGYEIESLPKPQSIHTIFGDYAIQFIYNNNEIEVIRYQTGIKQQFPATDYEKLVDFYNVMYLNDHAQVVLKKI